MAGRNKSPGRGRRSAAPAPPASGYLDSFTQSDIQRMHRRTAEFAQYCKAVYFDLEKQRSQHQDELIAALSTAGKPMTLNQWVRVTDYQWCLSPLCTAGSLKRIGGRFNIGQELAFIATPFPALYIAENAATAMSEYCGPPASRSALSQHELALRRPASFANFSIEGQLSNVLDLRDLSALEDFVAIIKKFKLTRDTRQLARKYNLPARPLVRSTQNLQDRVLAASDAWRIEPLLADIPAANQIFARYVQAAGYEGVLYPSQRGAGLCLALYPQNFAGSDSYLQVIGAVPPGATCTRLDRTHLCLNAL